MTGSRLPNQWKAPVFSGIFSEDTIAHSNYNSFQALFEKRFSHGLQFQASYNFSKSLDNASSFESALNPLNFNATYGLSNYDSRQRFVVNYVWDLPVPKFEGFKGKLLDGWDSFRILSFQSGFPVRITSQDDVEPTRHYISTSRHQASRTPRVPLNQAQPAEHGMRCFHRPAGSGD